MIMSCSNNLASYLDFFHRKVIAVTNKYHHSVHNKLAFFNEEPGAIVFRENNTGLTIYILIKALNAEACILPLSCSLQTTFYHGSKYYVS